MKNFISKHATQAAYTLAQSTFDKPHVAFIKELAGLADSVRYMERMQPISHDYSQDYFTTIPLVDATFTFTVEAGELSYSIDNGTNWSESISGEIVVNVSAGNKLLWKGALEYTNYGNKITCDESFNVEGNVMSLLYGDNFANQTVIPQDVNLMSLFEESPLVNAQNLILPATTLTQSCYNSMFAGCSSLTTAPELPATTLAQGCYYEMFNDCSSLTTAPALPATTLAENCYAYMFKGCSLLTTAPELPATTLTTYCYCEMFSNCSSLNYIKCLATDISASNCTSEWVNSVAASGTFVKNASMSSWTTGYNGIPSGWTVQDASVTPVDPVTPSHNYANDYFTTIPLADATFTFTVNAGELSYSTDNGTTWSESTSGEIVVSNITAGNKVLWKGALEYADYISQITCDESFNVEGNIMSLLYGDNFANQTVIPQYASLHGLFELSSLVNAQNLILPATTLADWCYQNMFNYCTSLTTAPELPATTLTIGCYNGMFSGCSSLTTAPELPATTLAQQCYGGMFDSCNSLTYIKCLATDISANGCTDLWVGGVSVSGTFVKNASMSSWTTDISGIPSGWTIQDAA